ncbi:MAG: glycosyltransferase [Eubacteriales bacterium]|nr:glycosyltransferase [Eubacteriales bacterium]
MRILLVIDQFDEGNNGTTISAQRFAEALQQEGNEVRVAAAGKPAAGKYPMPRIRLLPVADSIVKSQGMVFARPDTATLQQAIRWADVVHFMMPFALSRVGLRMAKEMGKPVTAAFHVQPENITSTLHLGKNRMVNELLYDWFRDDFYNQFTHIHCPSEFIAGQLRAHGYRAKLHVISNGVSEQFHPRRMEKEPELAHKFVILSVGRYSQEKRQDVLIRAVKKSVHSAKIQLILAGQGPRERALRRMGRGLNNPPVMGFFETDRLCELMAMSDLYVHAADVEIEAIACLEAVASGLVPVIANSPLSATPQFALDQRSLFRAGDPADLARHIDWWYEHATIRHQMGRVYAESAEKYRLKNSIRLAEQMFAEAIAENRKAQ